MRHTVEDLLAAVYQHYPRGIDRYDPRYSESVEYARLVAARKKAGADGRYRAMLHRILTRYCVEPQSIHLPTGHWDACYALAHHLSATPSGRSLHFLASFLIPYQIVFSSQLIEDTEQTAALRGKPIDEVSVDVNGIQFDLPRSAVPPGLLAELDQEQRHAEPIREFEVRYELEPEEAQIAEWISQEVEATFGCERMPPEVGIHLVPDVATNLRQLGEARLFDCLFSDHHPWVKVPRSCSERVVRRHVDASRMPASFLPVATVLGAAAAIWACAQAPGPGGVNCAITTDGTLDKQRVLALLAETKAAVGSTATHDLLIAARDLEAAVAAWDGRGEPTEAMVACAAKAVRHVEASSNRPR